MARLSDSDFFSVFAPEFDQIMLLCQQGSDIYEGRILPGPLPKCWHLTQTREKREKL